MYECYNISSLTCQSIQFWEQFKMYHSNKSLARSGRSCSFIEFYWITVLSKYAKFMFCLAWLVLRIGFHIVRRRLRWVGDSTSQTCVGAGVSTPFQFPRQPVPVSRPGYLPLLDNVKDASIEMRENFSRDVLMGDNNYSTVNIASSLTKWELSLLSCVTDVFLCNINKNM